MGMTKDALALSDAVYAARKRDLLTPRAAKPAPPSLADKPDEQCIDVRTLSAPEYLKHKAELLGRRS